MLKMLLVEDGLPLWNPFFFLLSYANIEIRVKYYLTSNGKELKCIKLISRAIKFHFDCHVLWIKCKASIGTELCNKKLLALGLFAKSSASPNLSPMPKVWTGVTICIELLMSDSFNLLTNLCNNCPTWRTRVWNISNDAATRTSAKCSHALHHARWRSCADCSAFLQPFLIRVPRTLKILAKIMHQ